MISLRMSYETVYARFTLSSLALDCGYDMLIDRLLFLVCQRRLSLQLPGKTLIFFN